MRRYSLVLAAVLTLWIVGDHAILAQNPADNCGPRYRRDPVATNQAREAKKAALRRYGMPERFLHLLDREECVACVEMASDAFHIKVVYNDDANAPVNSKGFRWTSHTFKWDPQSERWAREQLAAGKIKAFYIMNTATRCQCCPDVNDDSKTNASYADWDAELDLHRSHVIPFEKPGDLGPLPPDLENPPAGWTEDVPNIQQFFKPPRRYAHPMCQICQPIADRWNDAAATLDYLWDRKLSLQEGIAITENAMANRRNQIARLEYQQLFASTASDARQKQIDDLKRVNDQQQQSVEYETRRLAEVDQSIADQSARMAAIMKELLACEEKCKTTAAAPPAATTAGNAPPVVANPPPPSPAPPAQTGNRRMPQASCPQCQPAAAEVGRIFGLIDARNAELQREQALLSTNTANLNNVSAMRAEELAKNNAARAAELDRRMADLHSANRDIQTRMFAIQQDIARLNDELATAVQNLESCNLKCAGDPGTGSGVGVSGPGRAGRTAAVPPLNATAACHACASLAEQLGREHQRLQDLARRANDRQVDADFQEFDDQRVRVADLERQLAACNAKCATAAGATTGGGVTTGGNVTTDATPDAGGARLPQALCPQCQTAAAEVARISGLIRSRSLEKQNEQSRHAINDQNLNTLSGMRAAALAAADGAARVAEIDRRMAELRNANSDIRARIFNIDQAIRDLDHELALAIQNLEACNRRCGGGSGAGIGTIGSGGRPDRTVVVPPLNATAACQACEALANQVRAAHAALTRLAQRANDLQIESDLADFEDQRAALANLERQLSACNQKCAATTTTDRTTTGTTGATPPAVAAPETTAACYGNTCGETWRSCSETNTCKPVETDCGVPGACDPRPCTLSGGGDCLDLGSRDNWTSIGNDVDASVQVKQVDVLDPPCTTADSRLFCGKVRFNANNQSRNVQWVGPFPRREVRQWFNPLGLLARSVMQTVERWRGSMGPAALIRPDDLKALAPYSGGQAAGLPSGVHLLMVDAGGSTGRTLSLRILNLTDRPVQISSLPFSVEPIAQQAQQRIQQAFTRLSSAAPVELNLSAYCVEFLKAPPRPNTLLRLAPPAVQQKYASMSKVLQSAYRVQQAGLLRPDSNPAAYTDSIKQWAVWAVEQRLNEKSFTEAFIGHTKKNVEAAGQQFPRQAEDMLRKVSPNRWQDITRILRGAGVPLPQ